MKKGKFFKYPNFDKIYELKKVVNNIYHFKCGHWCTNCVFVDLIDISTGIAEWQKPKQLTLNL
jgi:hypothetical protein